MAETSTLIQALHSNIGKCHSLPHNEIERSSQDLKTPVISNYSYGRFSDEYNIQSTKVWDETYII